MTSSEQMPPDEARQGEVVQEFLAGDDGTWTIVYSSGDLGLFAGFAPAASAPAILQDYRWDIRIGGGGPSLWWSSKSEFGYDRSSGDNGVEPIAIVQDHLGVLPRMLPQLHQEFCLYHNLWHAESTTYKKLYDDGTVEVACEVSDTFVRVRTKLLRQFQAAAQVVLVRYIDSLVATARFCDDPGLGQDFEGDDHRLRLTVGGKSRTGGWSSLLIGKKLILPPPISECGQGPFESREDADYPEFVVGETPVGEPVKSTCDPDKLGNYFGSNPDAFDYVTPVHFNLEVLDRYYADPKYEVRDGYLACGGLWGMSLDNNHPDHVTVWLGDLGRDLPERERHHWLAHNIFVPEGAPSQTAIRRGIRGEWAEADSPAWRLQRAYESFRAAWAATWGWDLLQDHDGTTPGLLSSLRIPPRGGDAEFGGQIQTLHLLLVDGLNAKQLKSELPKGPPGEKSIALLERWLAHKDPQQRTEAVSFLRKINDLRNVFEHRAGTRRAKVLQKHQIDDDRQKAVAAIFEEAITILESLGATLPGSDDSQG